MPALYENLNSSLNTNIFYLCEKDSIKISQSFDLDEFFQLNNEFCNNCKKDLGNNPKLTNKSPKELIEKTNLSPYCNHKTCKDCNQILEPTADFYSNDYPKRPILPLKQSYYLCGCTDSIWIPTYCFSLINESDEIPDDIIEKEKENLEQGTFHWLGTSTFTDIECYGLINQANVSRINKSYQQQSIRKFLIKDLPNLTFLDKQLREQFSSFFETNRTKEDLIRKSVNTYSVLYSLLIELVEEYLICLYLNPNKVGASVKIGNNSAPLSSLTNTPLTLMGYSGLNFWYNLIENTWDASVSKISSMIEPASKPHQITFTRFEKEEYVKENKIRKKIAQKIAELIKFGGKNILNRRHTLTSHLDFQKANKYPQASDYLTEKKFPNVPISDFRKCIEKLMKIADIVSDYYNVSICFDFDYIEELISLSSASMRDIELLFNRIEHSYTLEFTKHDRYYFPITQNDIEETQKELRNSEHLKSEFSEGNIRVVIDKDTKQFIRFKFPPEKEYLHKYLNDHSVIKGKDGFIPIYKQFDHILVKAFDRFNKNRTDNTHLPFSKTEKLRIDKLRTIVDIRRRDIQYQIGPQLQSWIESFEKLENVEPIEIYFECSGIDIYNHHTKLGMIEIQLPIA